MLELSPVFLRCIVHKHRHSTNPGGGKKERKKPPPAFLLPEPNPPEWTMIQCTIWFTAFISIFILLAVSTAAYDPRLDLSCRRLKFLHAQGSSLEVFGIYPYTTFLVGRFLRDTPPWAFPRVSLGNCGTFKKRNRGKVKRLSCLSWYIFEFSLQNPSRQRAVCPWGNWRNKTWHTSKGKLVWSIAKDCYCIKASNTSVSWSVYSSYSTYLPVITLFFLAICQR